MTYVSLIGLLSIILVAIGGRWLFYRYGRQDQKLENVEKENEMLKDRPRTLDDVRKRLQDYIDSKD